VTQTSKCDGATDIGAAEDSSQNPADLAVVLRLLDGLSSPSFFSWSGGIQKAIVLK